MTKVFSKSALPVGTMVQEYRIIQVLGEGGFGIVYLAENKYFSEIVALKEFLPSNVAYRLEGENRIVPLSLEMEKSYYWARRKFLEEAKTLRELGHPNQHPNIVRVKQFIEANDTAYMVMDLEKGKSLKDILKQRGPLAENEILGILYPLLDGLERIHSAFVWHRDIKPNNILIRPDGSPVLIDFGAARKDIDGRDQSMMAIYSVAYAAPEQFHPDGNQGPWTDIYELGATLYKAVTGSPPTSASLRLQDDNYHVPAIKAAVGDYSPNFLTAIDKALRLYPHDRPQSIAEWRTLFAKKSDIDDDKTRLRPAEIKSSPKKEVINRGFMAFIFLSIMGVLLVIGWWFFQDFNTPTVVENKPYSAEENLDEKTISKVYPPAPVRASLTIVSVPEDAQVFVDGKYRGSTPLDAVVDGGTHTLRLALEDHYDWESTLLVEEKVEIPIRIPMLKR